MVSGFSCIFYCMISAFQLIVHVNCSLMCHCRKRRLFPNKFNIDVNFVWYLGEWWIFVNLRCQLLSSIYVGLHSIGIGWKNISGYPCGAPKITHPNLSLVIVAILKGNKYINCKHYKTPVSDTSMVQEKITLGIISPYGMFTDLAELSMGGIQLTTSGEEYQLVKRHNFNWH